MMSKTFLVAVFLCVLAFKQAACDLAQDIEYAEATLATFERAKTAFQRVMLDVTTNDIDLEVRDTVADIARGLRSLKVPKKEIRAFKIASKQHRDFAFKIAYDLSFASDILGNIGQEVSAILQSGNLEKLKLTHDSFLKQELQLNKFYPLFTNNLNFNNEETIVLKSLNGIEGPEVVEIKSFIVEVKIVLSESRSDLDLAYAIYRKLITDANTMTQIVINQIEQ